MKLKIEFFSPRKINIKNFGERARKARELVNFVKIESVSIKGAVFSVYDPESKKTHYVIYRDDLPLKWSCDCTYFSLKQDFCAHILAVHLFLYYKYGKKMPKLTQFF